MMVVCVLLCITKAMYASVTYDCHRNYSNFHDDGNAAVGYLFCVLFHHTHIYKISKCDEEQCREIVYIRLPDQCTQTAGCVYILSCMVRTLMRLPVFYYILVFL